MWVNYYCSRVLRIVVRGSQSGFQLNRIPPDDQAERTPFLPGDPLSGIPRALFLGEPLMKEDSTFLLSESTGWIVDWAHPAFEICRDKHRGSTYGKITYTVTKDPGHDWKAEVGDGK